MHADLRCMLVAAALTLPALALAETGGAGGAAVGGAASDPD
jgi:hypothetical protein